MSQDRFWAHWRSWLGCLALAFVVSSCSTKSGRPFDPRPIQTGDGPGSLPATNLTFVAITNAINPEWLVPSTNAFRLGPGDQLDIELIGEGEGPESTFVGPDGRIYFSVLPGLQVWGKSLEEIRQILADQLKILVRDPQVAITLREVQSQRVWVMGRINTPGIYPLGTPMTVIEAISKAGGLFTSRFSGSTEELADLHHSFIMRRGQHLPINFHQLIREGATHQNIYLEPDDFVYLPSSLSSEVHILGAVNQPRAVGFKDQVTLISAMATAKGPAKDAWLKHIAIVRGSLTEPQIAIVDYEAIVMGRATDIRLEPRDIVFVPFSPYRNLNAYAKLIVNTFVKTIAANEGGRAVSSKFQPPGVAIPIQF